MESDTSNQTQRPGSAKYIALAIAIAAIVTATSLYFGGSLKLSPQARKLVGKMAPDLVFQTEEGQQKSVSTLQGSAILINFWASWCEPCMKEMPSLRALENHFAARGLIVLAFNVGDTKDNLRMDLRGNDFPKNLVFVFSKQQLKAYEIGNLPLSVLIDRRGFVRRIYLGAQEWTSLNLLREIEDALG